MQWLALGHEQIVNTAIVCILNVFFLVFALLSNSLEWKTRPTPKKKTIFPREHFRIAHRFCYHKWCICECFNARRFCGRILFGFFIFLFLLSLLFLSFSLFSTSGDRVFVHFRCYAFSTTHLSNKQSRVIDDKRCHLQSCEIGPLMPGKRNNADKIAAWSGKPKEWIYINRYPDVNTNRRCDRFRLGLCRIVEHVRL